MQWVSVNFVGIHRCEQLATCGTMRHLNIVVMKSLFLGEKRQSWPGQCSVIVELCVSLTGWQCDRITVDFVTVWQYVPEHVLFYPSYYTFFYSTVIGKLDREASLIADPLPANFSTMHSRLVRQDRFVYLCGTANLPTLAKLPWFSNQRCNLIFWDIECLKPVPYNSLPLGRNFPLKDATSYFSFFLKVVYFDYLPTT